jgi:hypothetical protein
LRKRPIEARYKELAKIAMLQPKMLINTIAMQICRLLKYSPKKVPASSPKTPPKKINDCRVYRYIAPSHLKSPKSLARDERGEIYL